MCTQVINVMSTISGIDRIYSKGVPSTSGRGVQISDHERVNSLQCLHLQVGMTYGNMG